MKPYALIVTGNQEQARRYQKALRGIGYQVQSVTTGARAQVQLTFTTPNLIILDMQLPDIPGEVVLRQINAARRLAESHLILLSVPDKQQVENDRPAPLHILERSISPTDLAVLAEEISSISL